MLIPPQVHEQRQHPQRNWKSFGRLSLHEPISWCCFTSFLVALILMPLTKAYGLLSKLRQEPWQWKNLGQKMLTISHAKCIQSQSLKSVKNHVESSSPYLVPGRFWVLSFNDVETERKPKSCYPEGRRYSYTLCLRQQTWHPQRMTLVRWLAASNKDIPSDISCSYGNHPMKQDL